MIDKKTRQKLLRKLPSVNDVLRMAKVQEQIITSGSVELKLVINQVLTMVREQILAGERETVQSEELLALILDRLASREQYSLRRVVNGTGVVLHTNLGRAVLSREIQEHVNQVMCAYSNLEYSLAEKQRGLRYDHVRQLLRTLTGAEDAIVVNNNAAAVMLVLDSLVQNREVIISRGELVEIGGSFRIPEIITKGGGKLREVGTTNKTHLADYQAAMSEETGAILKVHTSNYRIVGFTERPSIEDLYQLANQAEVPLINDLGSGLLIDLSKYGLPREPLIQGSVKNGDIVTFSGDKLLGGPQVGVIAGKRSLIEQIKKNQLLRALRVDKVTLAALEATLKLYLNPATVTKKVPTLRMITTDPKELTQRAQRLASQLGNLPGLAIDLLPGTSQIGGGAFPDYRIPTTLVAVKPKKGGPYSSTQLEEKLRMGAVPIICRLEHDELQIDVRTLQRGDDDLIVKRLEQLLSLG